MTADIIVDLQYGDCAKGKVAHYLCKTRKYSHVLRYNGGGNAGHTIYHNDKKFVTHYVPAGVFFGIRSIIGSGCVLNAPRFLNEVRLLNDLGIKTEGILYVANNAHIVTAAHLKEDGADSTIGTTKSGNGPAYRDKYARTGIRAESIPELKPFLIDLYKEFHENTNELNILCEGAQGFGLDIDWGDYPFVTSSHTTAASALLNAIPAKAVREIWGVAKMYETYVGAKKFEPNDPIFGKIRELGEEYGATTGRPRQCNWLNLDLIIKAARINGITHAVFSKVDVLRQINKWVVLESGIPKKFPNEAEMKDYMTEKLATIGVKKENIYFSDSKDKI